MPLDGHSYLVSQGWSGKGNGLRQGAISRPLAIPRKKTLAGLGKDRDEAFPFWDHLFTAAAKSIQVKVSEDSDNDDAGSTSDIAVKRTSTGIISNRRPVAGTPATSGTSTPDSELSGNHRLSLLAIAKREAAKRGLYAKFFRGPVLGPDTDVDVGEAAGEHSDNALPAAAILEKTVKLEPKRKRKLEDSAAASQERREKKKRKRETKEAGKLAKWMKRQDAGSETATVEPSDKKSKNEKEREWREREKLERTKPVGEELEEKRRKRKEEKRKEKDRKKAKASDVIDENANDGRNDGGDQSQRQSDEALCNVGVSDLNKKKKGKRKAAH